jgi:hypothetical protein
VLLDAGPQVLLEFHAFRSILLYKIDAGHTAIEATSKQVSLDLGWVSPPLSVGAALRI